MVGDRRSAPVIIGMALGFSMAGFSGCMSSDALKFRGTSAATYIKTIEESKDPNARYHAYDKLASSRAYNSDEQKARAAQLLTAKMKSGNEPIATRAVICRTLGMLGQPSARQVILVATNDEDPLVRAEACRAVGRVGRPEDSTILARIMILDVSFECKVAAIESLGELKAPDRRIYELLVTGMEHEQPVIRVASLNALRKITGQDLGVDVQAWKKYVEANAPKATTPPPATGSIPAAATSTTLPETTRDLAPPEIP